MTRLVLATGNRDKVAEVRAIISSSAIRIVPVTDILPGWGCDETGDTIEENALLKARKASQETGMPAVADDTGLFVSALGGAPGIYTARFAGGDATYEDNVRKLLRVMRWERGAARLAEFRTAAAYSDPAGSVLTAIGVVRGYILEEPRGADGFGYDPVFMLPELGCSFAECPSDVKNGLSHRAKAFSALREALERTGGGLAS